MSEPRTEVEFMHPGDKRRPEGIPENMILVEADYIDAEGCVFRMLSFEEPETFKIVGEEKLRDMHAQMVTAEALKTPRGDS